jgi:hypothetical protein
VSRRYGVLFLISLSFSLSLSALHDVSLQMLAPLGIRSTYAITHAYPRLTFHAHVTSCWCMVYGPTLTVASFASSVTRNMALGSDSVTTLCVHVCVRA